MQLVRDAIAAGIFNDLGSGSYVDLCVITKDKVEYLRPFDEANEKGRRLVSLVIFVSLYHPLLYVFIRISISSISTNFSILSSSVSIMSPLLLCFRQGSYRYKPGTTAVISKEVRKINFDITSETVQPVAMETS